MDNNKFQYEYESKEFSLMMIKFLCYSVNPIYEEYHVIKAIEHCAKDMSEQIINLFKHLTIEQCVNETYFDSDWYIRSKVDDYFDIENTMFTKTQTNHRIMFSFQRMRGIDMQNLKRELERSFPDVEDIRKKIFKENLIEDNPKIIISFSFVQNVLTNKDYSVLIAMLNHELRHVADQYVLEFYNTITNRKNSLFTDFKENNIFNLDKKLETYQTIFNILYYITKEEQRARIQATYSVCQNIKKTPKLYSSMTLSYNMVRYFIEHEPSYRKKYEENYRKFIFSVLRMEPFSYLHRLKTFSNLINKFLFGNYGPVYKELLVLGYFMYKHNYLYIYSENCKKDGVKLFFSEKNVRLKLSQPYSSNDDEYYYIVLKSLHRNYNSYENIIYNTVGPCVKKLFNINTLGESIVDTYNKLAKDNDLSLTDEQVTLINESYNAYQYALEKALFGDYS